MPGHRHPAPLRHDFSLFDIYDERISFHRFRIAIIFQITTPTMKPRIAVPNIWIDGADAAL